MSLNTNSWDFIYTAYSGYANKALKTNGLFSTVKIIYTNKFELNVNSTSVDFDSILTTDDKKIPLTVTFNGNYKVYDTTTNQWGSELVVTGLKLTFNLLLEWVNVKDKMPTQSDLDILVSNNPYSTNMPDDDLKHFFNKAYSATNTLNASSSTITNNPFYDYFLYLSFFDTTWMNPEIVRIGRLTNKYATDTTKKTYISFCYMLSRKENTVEKAFNNNDAYVDLNAIPEGATSALLIDRSVFAEYMVKNAFSGADNLFSADLASKLDKSGAYSFTNSEEITLNSKDYVDESGTAVAGKVPAGKLNISVEESSIKVSMSDVAYVYNRHNTPTVNQEYVFNLKYAPLSESKIASTSQEKLFIISNEFKKSWFPWLMDYGINLGLPLVKNLILEPIWVGLEEKPVITNFMMVKKPNTNENRDRSLTAQYNRNQLQMREPEIYVEADSELQILPSDRSRKGSDRVSSEDLSEALPNDVEYVVKAVRKDRAKSIELQTVKGSLDKGYLYYLFNKNDFLLNNCKDMIRRLRDDDIKETKQTYHQPEIDLMNKYIDFLTKNKKIILIVITKPNGHDLPDILNQYQAKVQSVFAQKNNFSIGDNREEQGSIYFFKENNTLLEDLSKEKSNLNRKKSKAFEYLKLMLDEEYKVSDIYSFEEIIGTLNKQNETLGLKDKLKVDWIEDYE